MKAYDSAGQIAENLKDAGCTDEVIEDFLEELQENNLAGGIKLLQRHRQSLLGNIHQWQKKIDCLDYLIYQMKKKN